jgi:hypothetical protein
LTWARVHRWLAILLVALLVVWSVTGVLFHLKPGWDRAYDMLTAERRTPISVAQLASLDSLDSLGSVSRIELFDTAIGPLYRVRTTDATDLVDATTGRTRSPLTADDAHALISDAVSRSSHRAAYGDFKSLTLEETTARAHFSSGAVIDLGRRDARISQRGPDTERIDWLYRIHYLQWTGNKTFDRAFAVFGLVLIWAVMIPGLVLFVRRVRQNLRS